MTPLEALLLGTVVLALCGLLYAVNRRENRRR